MPFYAHQNRIVLANCGLIDPTDLEDSIAHGGYASIAAIVIEKMSPEEVIEVVTRSGLRGRGGAGFLTGPQMELHSLGGRAAEICCLQRR